MLFTEECNDMLPNTATRLKNSTNISVKRKGKPLIVAVNSQGYKEPSFIKICSMGKGHLRVNRQGVSVEAKPIRTTTKVHEFNTVKSQQGNIIVQEKLKLNPSNKTEAVIGIAKQFCNECSVDAAQYLVHKLYRKIWAIFFIAVIFYCLFQCKLNINKYLKYELSITVAEERVSTTDFPAITICPMTQTRKSTLGQIFLYYYGLTEFNIHKEDELKALLVENQKSCNNGITLSDEERLLLYNDYIASFYNGSIWLINKYFMNYQDFLLKCAWNNADIGCENVFLNHVTDSGTCFTFNPGENFVHFMNDTKSGYGINIDKYKEHDFKTFQGQSGLKLYMTVNQEEYCGNDIFKRGAGFYFQVHGLDRSPSFFLNPSTYLNPGYDIQVNIAKKVYKRNTESLGNCTEFVKLYMTPNVTFYVQEHCFMQCVAEYIIKECNCYPPSVGTFKKLFQPKAEEFNIAGKDVCFHDHLVCMRAWQFNTLTHSSTNDLCPYCKQPCEETRYTTITTSLLLSPRNLKISEFSNISFEQLRKNYIVVTFNLQTSNVEKIVEDQMFTIRDLFIYMGNNIGLYLGMSFTTIFEILYFIIEILVCLCKC